MTGGDVPATVDPWTVSCGDVQLAVDEQGRALCLPASHWATARDSDLWWDSYWSVWPSEDVINRAATTGSHRAQHLMGALTLGEELHSIEVQVAGEADWIRCPFAVAGRRVWLAHAPRWTTRALIATSTGTKDLSWTYRRYADYNQDLPDGVDQLPRD